MNILEKSETLKISGQDLLKKIKIHYLVVEENGEFCISLDKKISKFHALKNLEFRQVGKLQMFSIYIRKK